MATPREAGHQNFLLDIQRLAESRTAGATFSVEECTRSSATLSGAVPAGEHTASAEALAAWLASAGGIDLNLDVTLLPGAAASVDLGIRNRQAAPEMITAVARRAADMIREEYSLS